MVANVFAQSEFSIVADFIKLRDKFGTAGFERFQIFIRKPLSHLTLVIILRALIVNSMTKLVAHNCADGGDVFDIGYAGIKKWKLQNPLREYELIIGWIVVSVYNQGRHVLPTAWIAIFRELFQLFLDTRFAVKLHVAVRSVGRILLHRHKIPIFV